MLRRFPARVTFVVSVASVPPVLSAPSTSTMRFASNARPVLSAWPTVFPSRGLLALPALSVLSVLLAATGARAESAPSVAPAPASPASSPPSAAPPCTLAGVLERVRTSPRADAIAAEVAGAAALETQAAVRPNPKLGLEVEDFTGSGPYSRFGQSQTTLALSQPIELGGRRSSRKALAARGLAAQQVRALRDRVRAEVVAKQALVDLLAAREELELRRRDAGLARELSEHAALRARSGAASAADAEQASVAASSGAIAVSDAERAVVVAEHRLVSLWGGRHAEAACFTSALALPADADLAVEQEDLERSPAVALAEADVDLRRAEVAMARSEVSPELNVAAGLRYLAGSDNVSVVTGLQVEVPVFDRNAGNVQAAEQGLFASQARARLARQEAEFDIVRVRESVLAAHRRASILAGEAIPSAERALAIQRKAWSNGAASYLDLAAAQRSLLALQLDHLDAVVDYHSGHAALEGFAGTVSSGWTTTKAVPARTARTNP